MEEDPVATRRAPFSDNPRVGARGQQTRRRILDAALEVFAEDGYHASSIARITGTAGCSQATFYQYFEGKEVVFRHLVDRLCQEAETAAEAMGPVMAANDGWQALRDWLGASADLFQRYQPALLVLHEAEHIDGDAGNRLHQCEQRLLATVGSKAVSCPLPAEQFDRVLGLLLETVPTALAATSVLRSAAPDAYPDDRMLDTFTDVIHRTFFGRKDTVNVHPADDHPPELDIGPVIANLPGEPAGRREMNAAGRRTFAALKQVGRDVFVARGYHNTRVDDIVAAAGLSHGAFYRHFRNKRHLAEILATDAVGAVAAAMGDLPEALDPAAPPGHNAVRSWLTAYNRSYAPEAAMFRVWAEGAGLDTAGPADWGRRRAADFLEPRGFGDVEREGILLVALLSAFGSRPRGDGSVDAAAHIVRAGFVGL